MLREPGWDPGRVRRASCCRRRWSVRLPYFISVSPQFETDKLGESVAMWRVSWVPQDAVRTGVRKRVLNGWEDLPALEDEVGVRAGDPIFLSPDHRVDPLLSLYAQSTRFRRYTAETQRNYATDIALLLTFLWNRGKETYAKPCYY
jgi:hypothetical protein